MANPHFSDAEYRSLRDMVSSTASTWADYVDFAQDSDVRKNFKDPSVFQAEQDQLYSEKARTLAGDTRRAMEKAKAGRYSRGLNSGASGRVGAEIATAQVGRIANLRADTDAEAERLTMENEERWMGMMRTVGDLESDALGAQQKYAQRLGEQSAYDKQYKNSWRYSVSDPAAERFYREMGWGEIGDRSALNRSRGQRFATAQSKGGTGGDWNKWQNTGDSRHLPDY